MSKHFINSKFDLNFKQAKKMLNLPKGMSMSKDLILFVQNSIIITGSQNLPHFGIRIPLFNQNSI